MNKKTKKIIVVIAVVVILLIVAICMNIDIKKVNENYGGIEFIPEEEISDEQFRETMIKIFYVGKNNEIKEEIKKIDSKELVKDPYNLTMELLLKKPESENLKTCIPEGVKINNINKSGECLTIDLSKEFIENMDDNVEIQGLSVGQIVNTMTQYTEINKVKILIDGNDDITFKNGNINFKQVFTNED